MLGCHACTMCVDYRTVAGMYGMIELTNNGHQLGQLLRVGVDARVHPLHGEMRSESTPLIQNGRRESYISEGT